MEIKDSLRYLKFLEVTQFHCVFLSTVGAQVWSIFLLMSPNFWHPGNC